MFSPSLEPLRHQWGSSSLSFPSRLELLAQPRTALSDVTDVVGKYRFADAELMWQVSIIEFHSQAGGVEAFKEAFTVNCAA